MTSICQGSGVKGETQSCSSCSSCQMTSFVLRWCVNLERSKLGSTLASPVAADMTSDVSIFSGLTQWVARTAFWMNGAVAVLLGMGVILLVAVPLLATVAGTISELYPDRADRVVDPRQTRFQRHPPTRQRPVLQTLLLRPHRHLPRMRHAGGNKSAMPV